MISSAQLILACDIYWQIESPKIPSSDWGARQSGGEKSRASPPSFACTNQSAIDRAGHIAMANTCLRRRFVDPRLALWRQRRVHGGSFLFL
jgi:hypothetical protein